MTFQTDTLSQPDLSVCDREPIHIPGSIQPHGILLALAPDNLTISHVSANIDGLLKDPAAGAIGRPLADMLPTLAAALAPNPQSRIIADSAESIGHIVLSTAAGPAGFATAVHRSGELLVIELEETAPGEEASRDTLYPMLQGFVAQLQSAGTPEALSALAAQSVRRLTGFDRVLVYRFDADWNGTVIAEDRNETLPSYLDLRFPASDIPQQARELYCRNRLRIIPDAAYVPVAIAPAHDPRTGAPLDLSQSILRSVSPVHVEYMHNMGTMASMSISILRGGAHLLPQQNLPPRPVERAQRLRSPHADFLHAGRGSRARRRRRGAHPPRLRADPPSRPHGCGGAFRGRSFARSGRTDGGGPRERSGGGHWRSYMARRRRAA
jgi:chemotaxis family two-component system sensor kinase Cph1